jgi:pimeloyl-ACP methyl ester carboxylesterase
VTSGATARSVSRDGSAVLFASASSNLVTAPASSGLQLYVREFTTNSVPIVVIDVPGRATVRSEFVITGHFEDPDSLQSWNADATFGDDSSAPVELAADKTFVIRHTYRFTGTYALTVTVTDSAGGVGRTTVSITVKLRPVIFVPGLFGSELVASQAGTSVPIDDGHGGQQQIDYPGFPGNPVWLNLIQAGQPGEEDYFDLLKFDTATGIPFVTDIVPGTGLLRQPGSPYEHTEERFIANGYTKGVDFFVFTYDWRDASARSGDLLDVEVADVRLLTGSDSVDIVAHSQGGLVTRWFLLHGAQRQSAARVIMLGTPHLGAPLFGYALVGGTCFPPQGQFCVISSAELTDVLRTLPSAPEIAPSREYYRIFPNAVSALGDQHPAAYIDDRFFSSAELPELRGTRAQLIARELEAGVPQTYIDAADGFHEDDRDWISHIPSSTKLTLVAGTSVPTVAQVIETWSRETTNVLDGNGNIIGTRIQVVQRLEARHVDGDGTVVNESASLKDTASAGSNVDVIYAFWNHGNLTEPLGLPITLALLRDDDPTVLFTDRANRQGFPVSGTVISDHSPSEIVVTDVNGHRSGSVDGEHALNELPGSLYQRLADAKFVTLAGSPAVTATLYGTGHGGSLVRIRRFDAGVLVDQSLFSHVPTRPGSRATFTVAADGSVSAMQVDVDGDGAVDQTIAPTNLTAATADDTQPPDVVITSPDARAVVGAVRLNWSATDALAGIASAVATIDGGQIEYANGALVPTAEGTHRIDVFAEDRAANSEVASITFIANAYQWLEPIGDDLIFDANEGRTIPGRFRVTTPSGAFVTDTSVTVVLEDSNGQVVVGPLRSAASAAEGVAIEGDAYHVNVPTRGLGVGMYRIVVSFDSPTLVGQFSVPVRLR